MIASPQHPAPQLRNAAPPRRLTPPSAARRVARRVARGGVASVRGAGRIIHAAIQRVLGELWHAYAFYLALVLGRAVQVMLQQGIGVLSHAPRLIELFFLQPVFPALVSHPLIAIPAIAAVLLLGAVCHRANTLEFRRKLDHEILRAARRVHAQEHEDDDED